MIRRFIRQITSTWQGEEASTSETSANELMLTEIRHDESSEELDLDGYSSPRDLAWEYANDLTRINTGEVNKIILWYNQPCSPLHIAVLLGDFPSTNVLINRGAKLEAPDHNGYTPLHRATQLPGNIQVVEFLLDCGALINANNNKYKRSPLSSAIIVGDRNFAIVQHLVKRGADINLTDWQSWTALHHAVFHTESRIVMMLLRHNANLETRTKRGLETPLILALMRRKCKLSENIAKVLISVGANLDVKDRVNYRPLHYTMERPELFEMLVCYGADLDKFIKGPRKVTNIFMEDELEGDDLLRVHLVRLRALGNLKYKKLFERKKRNRYFVRSMEEDEVKCRKELEEMQMELLSTEYKASVKDVLTKELDTVARYLEIEGVKEKLDELVAKEAYPIYGTMLKYRLFRAEWLNRNYENLRCIFGRGKVLPAPCLRRLLFFLEDKDTIKALAAVGPKYITLEV